jgi:hypothetical protein
VSVSRSARRSTRATSDTGQLGVALEKAKGRTTVWAESSELSCVLTSGSRSSVVSACSRSSVRRASCTPAWTRGSRTATSTP